MKQSVGVLFQERSSSVTETGARSGFGEIAILLGLGVLLAASHGLLHQKLHLPGHHGAIVLAALLIARRYASHPWAATVACAGAAASAFAPMMGLSPATALFFLLPGPIVDIAHRVVPVRAGTVFFLTVLAAAANGVKPISAWLIAALTPIHFGSLAHGLAYPLASHLFFGACGGLLAAAILGYLGRRT